jgi:hypothetical protein
MPCLILSAPPCSWPRRLGCRFTDAAVADGHVELRRVSARVQIGTEELAVVRSADGWTISSSGRIGAPFELATRNLQIRYDADWKARELTLDATVRGQEFGLRISITGTTATTHVNNAGQTATARHRRRRRRPASQSHSSPRMRRSPRG